MAHIPVVNALVPMDPRIKENPYARFMGKRLSDRVKEIQESYQNTHYADLRHEMELMRATAIDILDMYRIAELESDEFKRCSMAMTAGVALRGVLAQIRDMAVACMQIEKELKGKHDPQITNNFIMQTVEVVTRLAQKQERIGFEASTFIKQVVEEVDKYVAYQGDGQAGVQHSGLGGQSSGGITPTAITPDMGALSMDDSIPYCTQPVSA